MDVVISVVCILVFNHIHCVACNITLYIYHIHTRQTLCKLDCVMCDTYQTMN